MQNRHCTHTQAHNPPPSHPPTHPPTYRLSLLSQRMALVDAVLGVQHADGTVHPHHHFLFFRAPTTVSLLRHTLRFLSTAAARLRVRSSGARTTSGSILDDALSERLVPPPQLTSPIHDRRSAFGLLRGGGRRRPRLSPVSRQSLAEISGDAGEVGFARRARTCVGGEADRRWSADGWVVREMRWDDLLPKSPAHE